MLKTSIQQSVKLNNNIQMPMVGFGTYSLLGENCIRCVSEAIEAGYRLIDTAQMYSNEKEVGKAVSHYKREDIFITTKLYSPSAGYSQAKDGIQKSLDNLQTDYIDLILIHEPYKHSLDMYRAMTEEYQKGRIKSIGISNFNSNLYSEFIKHCGVLPAINQVESHVFFPQLKLKQILSEKGTVMQAWSPLAAGRNNFFDNHILKRIGLQYGKTSAQIGLKYLIQVGISVIPKASSQDRIKSNIDLFDFELTDDDIHSIKPLDRGKSLFGWY